MTTHPETHHLRIGDHVRLSNDTRVYRVVGLAPAADTPYCVKIGSLTDSHPDRGTWEDVSQLHRV